MLFFIVCFASNDCLGLVVYFSKSLVLELYFSIFLHFFNELFSFDGELYFDFLYLYWLNLICLVLATLVKLMSESKF